MPKLSHQFTLLFICTLPCLLCACAKAAPNMNTPVMHQAMCSELSAQMLLNTATADERQVDIARAQNYLAAYKYDVNCQNVRSF